MLDFLCAEKLLKSFFIKKPSMKQNWGSKKCESIVFDTIFIQIAHKICITFLLPFYVCNILQACLSGKSLRKIKFLQDDVYQSKVHFDAFVFCNCFLLLAIHSFFTFMPSWLCKILIKCHEDHLMAEIIRFNLTQRNEIYNLLEIQSCQQYFSSM